ncbi:MAG: hypothetical protein WCD16_03770 [Paracoccaceae bacterium]
MSRFVLPLLLGLAACGGAEDASKAAFSPSYLGVETRLLDGDLVNFMVGMKGARGQEDLGHYADCAAAQYALIRGYGFARHIRTNVAQEGGVWRADAVYTISPGLPRGVQTIDAEKTVAHCADEGIPTV